MIQTFEEAHAIRDRLVIAYPVTEESVVFWMQLTGDEAWTEELCKAAALGCSNAALDDAARYSEATKADGIRLWIATQRRGGNRDCPT